MTPKHIKITFPKPDHRIYYIKILIEITNEEVVKLLLKKQNLGNLYTPQAATVEEIAQQEFPYWETHLVVE